MKVIQETLRDENSILIIVICGYKFIRSNVYKYILIYINMSDYHNFEILWTTLLMEANIIF
jgi:hypothetical protein